MSGRSDRPRSSPPNHVPGAARTITGAVLVASLGLLIQAAGYALGWNQDFLADRGIDLGMTVDQFTLWTYYIGLTLIIAPFVVVLSQAGLTRRQQVGGLLIYALTLYLSWMLLNPLMAVHFDENLQTTTMLGLLQGGNPFTDLHRPNTMLPVSPYYPGLGLVGAAIHWATGLPFIAVQAVTVMIARIVLVLALFGIFARVTKSDRAATIGLLLYLANSQFYYFDAQFNYDTQATALAALVMYLALLVSGASPRALKSLVPAATAAMAALTLTHHLGTWLTTGALWALALLSWFDRLRRPWAARRMVGLATMATGLVIAWTLSAGGLLASYLSPLFELAGDQIEDLLNGGGGRQLMSDTSGDQAALWQFAVMLGSMVIWCLMLAPAALAALGGRTLGTSWVRWLPLLVACCFPPSLLLRFSPNAAEIAQRAAAYLMMAVCLVVAAWLAPKLAAQPQPDRPRIRKVLGTGAVAALGLVLTVGGVLVGAGANWEHQNGRFMGQAQARAVDAETLGLAQWAHRYLPEGARIASDSTLNRVLPNFAPVTPVTGLSGSYNVTGLFLPDTLTPEGLDILTGGEVDFVISDTRLSEAEGRNGVYFEPSATFGDQAREISLKSLTKFAHLPGILTVLDAGPIKVYDARAIRAEPSTYADRSPQTLPGTARPWQLLVTFVMLLVIAGIVLDRRLGSALTGVTPRAARWTAFGYASAILLSLVGFCVGYRPAVGVAASGALVALAAIRLVRQPRGVSGASGPSRWLSGIAAGTLYVAAVTVAVVGCWHGFVSAAPSLPPPQGVIVVSPAATE